MYGTVARLQLKAGSGPQIAELTKEYEGLDIPGFVSTRILQTDANPDEVYLIALFESKEAYVANADNPAQHERFMKMRELLAADPEWHDGEVIYSVGS